MNCVLILVEKYILAASEVMKLSACLLIYDYENYSSEAGSSSDIINTTAHFFKIKVSLRPNSANIFKYNTNYYYYLREIRGVVIYVFNTFLKTL